MQRLVYFLSCFASFVTTDRVVMTSNGPVQGITVHSGEPEVEAFLGIPYAEPPVDHLRFRKPVPKGKWMGIYDATQQPPPCMQNNSGSYFDPDTTNMTEDCLFLSLWVPYTSRTTHLKPIIMYTHGGAFNTGSGNMQTYDGTNMAKFGDVIVVNFNYRVGVLGFFLAFTEDADGNMGLYDQILAMKWIKDNALSFGGDSDNIVLMGESAGAMVVGGHLASPLTKNLFKRVIMQSGAPTFNFLLDDNDQLHKVSQKFASMVNCADKNVTLKDSPSLVVQCMKRLPVLELTKIEGLLMQSNPITFFPRTGDACLPNAVIRLLKEGNFRDTEMLIGVDELEGAFFLTAAAPQYFGVNGVGRVNVISKRFASIMVQTIFQVLSQKNVKDIMLQYIDSIQNGTSDSYVEALARSIGDYIVNCPVHFHAEYHSVRNPVYYYVFSRRPSTTPLARWMRTTHFDEIQYVFGNPLFRNFTPQEVALSERVMARWIAFVKTGNPNVPELIEWPTFTRDDPKYLVINEEEAVQLRPDNYRCEFWRKRFEADFNDEIVSKIKSVVNLGISLTVNVLPIAACVLSSCVCALYTFQ